jgi:hypothetical protein
MKPFTKKQVAELPKGLTPAEQPGRKFFRDMKFNRLMATVLGIAKLYPMNCRKLTPGRKKHKTVKWGRLSNSYGRAA